MGLGWWWGLRRFFFQISNTYFLGTENVPSQPLTIFEWVAFIGHWNVRPHANPTIITLSHYPNTIPLFPFQSHFPLFNPTIIISIPLFAHQSHFFGHILIVPLLLFSYILLTSLVRSYGFSRGESKNICPCRYVYPPSVIGWRVYRGGQ